MMKHLVANQQHYAMTLEIHHDLDTALPGHEFEMDQSGGVIRSSTLMNIVAIFTTPILPSQPIHHGIVAVYPRIPSWVVHPDNQNNASMKHKRWTSPIQSFHSLRNRAVEMGSWYGLTPLRQQLHHYRHTESTALLMMCAQNNDQQEAYSVSKTSCSSAISAMAFSGCSTGDTQLLTKHLGKGLEDDQILLCSYISFDKCRLCQHVLPYMGVSYSL